LLAYHSTEGGRNIEVWVVDFPAFTNKRNVSHGWGRQPEWHPAGSELFFFGNKARTLMSARVKTGGQSFEEPEKVFDLPERIYSENPWRMSVFDVAPKGDRFLMLRDAETATNQLAKPNVQVVLNWFEEFRAKRCEGEITVTLDGTSPMPPNSAANAQVHSEHSPKSAPGEIARN
jgi:hypothetical protein